MEFLDILEDDSLYQSTIKEHLKERKIIVNETMQNALQAAAFYPILSYHMPG